MKINDINYAVLIWGVISPQGMQFLHRENKLIIVPEQRPFMVGLKRNCAALKRENLRYVYCNDNALGLFFYKNKIIKTLLFYKEKKEDGILAAAGSLYAVMLSLLHHVKVEILAEPGAPEVYQGSAEILGGRNFLPGKDGAASVVSSEDELIKEELLL